MNDTPEEGLHSLRIASEKISHARKIFYLDLKENHHSRYLKITENVIRYRNSIRVPRDALEAFTEALQRLIEFEGKL